MSDNNRLEYDIVANDDTGSATAKVKAGFRSMDEQAAKTAANINRSFDAQAVSMGQSIDRAAASAMRSLDALERRAALAGKSAVEKLVVQRNQLIGSLGTDEAAIQRTMAAYDKLISARQKYEAQMAKMDSGGGHGGNQVLRRGILGVKDFFEGSTRGAIIEGTDILVGTSGGGGILQKVIPQIAEVTGLSSAAVIAVGSLTAAFVGLGVAGLVSMRSLAATGEEIKNFSLRTGVAPDRVQAFQFAAKASGVNPDIVERMTRGLAQAVNEDSSAGNRARKEIKDLGVNLYDDIGDLKPTEQIILELADAINKLPPGLKQSAASLEIFKRIGVDAVPFLKDVRENFSKSDQIGNTFTEADLKMFEEWHKQVALMDEEWMRFKASVMKPLAVSATITLKAVNGTVTSGGQIPAGGQHSSLELNPFIPILRSMGLFDTPPPSPNPPGVPAGLSPHDFALQKRNDVDASIRAMNADREKDPRFKLQEAEKVLAGLEVPKLGVTKDQSVVDNYREALKRVEALKGSSSGSNTALEGVIAARKQGFELDAKYAEIQASAEQKRLSASLNTSKELMSPEDINTRLKLAELTAIAQKDKEVEARRKTIDTKTGAEVDLSGTPGFQKFQAAEDATLPKRIRNEYAIVLGELEAQDAKYFRTRTDADGKAWEQSWERRKKGEMDLQQEEINTRQQIQTHQFDIDASAIDRQKEMALQGLDSVDAQTLQQKIALEDRKLAIEQSYAERSLANQIAKILNEQALAVAEIQKKAADAGVDLNSDSVQGDIAATQDKYQQQIAAARASTGDREILDAQKAQSAKEKLAIESNKRVYDSLKHDAEGLFDQMVFHTKSWGAFAKDIVKAAVLTPVKEIFSSQVAALGTKGLTGQDVTFGEVGNGQGTFGKLGSIFGRAGLGQPKFGDANHPLAKLAAPNHIGDVSLVSGAVPVVLMNGGGGQGSQQISRPSSTGGFSLAPLAAGLGLGGLFAGGVTATPPFIASAITGGGGTANSYNLLDGIVDATSSPGTFLGGADQMLNIAGGTGNLGSSAFTQAFSQSLGSSATSSSAGGGIFSGILHTLGLGGGGAGGSSGGGGILGSIFGGGGAASGGGGFLSGLKGMLGQNVSGVDLGNGVGIANTGMMGHLAAFGQSGLAGMLGLGVAMDGIRRGGVVGTLEAAGGGAMVGFKYGGPIGAVIGAAVGGGIAAGKSIFGTTDRQHAKDLVKQVYGMKINDGMADQIVAIAKQSFGNQIDVAVRSPQVRDLLKLYAQAHGDKKAEDKFVQDTVHSASFSESGGKLFQNAVYDNGNAYSYASSLPTYGGVTTAPLSTYQPNQGVFSGNLSINLNGQSAADVLEGRVTNVVTPGFVQGQALSASSSSNGRTAQQNMTLSPSALTR